MFLIFSLGRPDIFSAGDRGLKNKIIQLYRLRKAPTVKRLQVYWLQLSRQQKAGYFTFFKKRPFVYLMPHFQINWKLSREKRLDFKVKIC